MLEVGSSILGVNGKRGLGFFDSVFASKQTSEGLGNHRDGNPKMPWGKQLSLIHI